MASTASTVEHFQMKNKLVIAIRYYIFPATEINLGFGHFLLGHLGLPSVLHDSCHMWRIVNWLSNSISYDVSYGSRCF